LITYNGLKWYHYQGALLPRVPTHQEVSLSRQEQNELLKTSRALFLRYTDEWNREEGAFWFVIKEYFGGMEELSANTRSKIRRGEKRNDVRQVDAEYIAQFGYAVYVHAFEQYNTFMDPIDQKHFKAHIHSQEDYEYWGVFDKQSNRLVGYSENFVEDNMCHYSTIKFHPDFLKNYTSYILFYEMNRYYLETKKMRYVNDGARSISHETNVQTFLMEKFKFKKAYARLHVVYRWDVGLAVQLLYPLKGLIGKIEHPMANKIATVLKQEAIRRSFG